MSQSLASPRHRRRRIIVAAPRLRPKPTPSFMTRVLARPEIGALIAAVVIYIFFFIVAPAFRSPESFSTMLYASSPIGIVAVGVGLLMIGGEFDLSAGVAVDHLRVDRCHAVLPVDAEHVGRRDRVAVAGVVHRVHQRVPGGANGDPVAS